MRVSGPDIARGRVGEAADKARSEGCAEIDHVKTSATGLATGAAPHGVGESGLLVDDDVVRTVDLSIEKRRFEGHGRICNVAELPEIEYLHSVLAGCVADDEDMIPVDLQVTPDAWTRPGCQGENPCVEGCLRVR